MDLTVIIPARLDARRFPGKALAPLLGRPLLSHVIERARAAWPQARVVVATDALAIARSVEVEAETFHCDRPARCGTERVAHAAASLGVCTRWVVNLQGDEPCVPPAALRAAVAALAAQPAAALGTACLPMGRALGLRDPDQVKAICDALGFARYFSRAPIPYQPAASPDAPDDAPARWLLHIGVYAFSPASLDAFATHPPTPTEQAPGPEKLRALEAGWLVAAHTLNDLSDRPWPAVNRPADLAAAARYLTSSTENPFGPNI
jgi:3-deoxy-manno-octulosonate cytidylyltransferase (CMP-KDO synthetase)